MVNLAILVFVNLLEKLVKDVKLKHAYQVVIVLEHFLQFLHRQVPILIPVKEGEGLRQSLLVEVDLRS